MVAAKSSHSAPRAAVGFRSHSGWTAFVVLGTASSARSARSPIVLARGRISLVDTQARGFKQPYHAAAGMDLKEAQELLRRSARQARLLARRALREMVASAKSQGYSLANCGIVLGSGRPLPPLATILRAHPLLHTAEGIFYRDALVRAAKDCRFPVTGISERELFTRAASDLQCPAHQVRRHLAAMGQPLGAPWRQDEKYSAVVAWLALENSRV